MGFSFLKPMSSSRNWFTVQPQTPPGTPYQAGQMGQQLWPAAQWWLDSAEPAGVLGPMTWSTLGMLPLHAVARALAQLACEQPVCSFSCYEVNLRGCLLQDLLVSFSRPPGSREEESFICRLGEIQVVDANSLLAPLPQVQNVTISQLRWLPLITGSEGLPTRLLLSCTLHWSYLRLRARCFRIHCWKRTGSSSVTEEFPETVQPMLLGLAFASQYRVVDLAVDAARSGQDGRVQFLVEPVPREGFLVPQAEWGRAVLLYSAPQ